MDEESLFESEDALELSREELDDDADDSSREELDEDADELSREVEELPLCDDALLEELEAEVRASLSESEDSLSQGCKITRAAIEAPKSTMIIAAIIAFAAVGKPLFCGMSIDCA